MQTANGSTAILCHDAEPETLEILCELVGGVDADQLILQLARALGRLAARKDDALAYAGSVAKGE